MAKYQVGQRVRIKWVHKSENQPLVGTETHITSIEHDIKWRDGVTSEDAGYKLSIRSAPYGLYMGEQLEPVIPDGAKPSEHADIADLLNSLMLNEVLLPEEPDWGIYNDGDDDESRG